MVHIRRINDIMINGKVTEAILFSTDLDFIQHTLHIIAALHEVMTVNGMTQKQAKSIQVKILNAWVLINPQS